MTVNSSTQLTLDFEGGLSERHSTCLSVVREGAYSFNRGLKSLAADMDLSQSELSRKLADNPNDPRNFTLEDLEKYISVSKDNTPIYYLVEKFLTDDETKHKRALAELAQHLPKITALIKALSIDEAV